MGYLAGAPEIIGAGGYDGENRTTNKKKATRIGWPQLDFTLKFVLSLISFYQFKRLNLLTLYYLHYIHS